VAPESKNPVFSCSGLTLLNMLISLLDDLTNIEGMGGLQRLQLTSKKLAVSILELKSLHHYQSLDLEIAPS